jgi:hypothetical protein
MTTQELLDGINGDEELPFGGWRDGKGLDARGLAKLLKPYGIKPRSIRTGDGSGTPKGYRSDDMQDAWKRYLPPEPGDDEPQRGSYPQHEIPYEHRDVADVADRCASDRRGNDGTAPKGNHASAPLLSGPSAPDPAEIEPTPEDLERAERYLRDYGDWGTA